MPKRKTAKKRTVKKSKSRLFLPFALLLFLMLCAGAYLLNATFRANAQSIQVTAKIQGPLVTDPATITSPASGTHFSAVPIVVTGNCTANAAYIEIFRGTTMSGSAVCTGSSTFELQIDLFAGQNILTAHIFNINDDEGPVSGPVTVFYDVPQAPSQPYNPAVPGQPTSSNGSPAANTPNVPDPLILKTAFVYKGYYVGQNVEWPLDISGGAKPYAFNIDWGDGSNSVISRKNDGPFNISHKYKKPGGYKGVYTIKVQASDSESKYAYLEFFVAVTEKSGALGIGSIYTKQPPALDGLKNWLWIAWPVYSTILLMVISYKLGMHEELNLLRHNGRLRRSH